MLQTSFQYASADSFYMTGPVRYSCGQKRTWCQSIFVRFSKVTTVPGLVAKVSTGAGMTAYQRNVRDYVISGGAQTVQPKAYRLVTSLSAELNPYHQTLEGIHL